MKITFQPLLQIQRELYHIPRGPERFRAYLQAMIDPQTDDLKLPIVAMNPMGKDHVPELLDKYLALDADSLAATAIAEVLPQVADAPDELKAALVLADDAKGGWTNRYFSEFSHCFQSGPLLKRGWITGVLWTSEEPSAQIVREEILRAVHRTFWIQEHGQARTLRQMLAQEGQAMFRAGCARPALDSDELEYTREIIAPSLDAEDQPTIMECLYGDEAARSLGYSPRGLSPRAGLALALHDVHLICKMPAG